MKYLFIFILLLVFFEPSFSQSDDRYLQQNVNLYDVKLQFDAYFDSIFATGDSALLDEGKDYANYKKYMDFWTYRLFPHGDFSRYFQAQKFFYSPTLPIPFSNSDPWWEIGPGVKPIPNTNSGCNGPVTNGNYGVGPVREIAFSKTNPDRMLCSNTRAGLFYFDPAVGQWQHTGTDTWPTFSGVMSAIFDPTDYHIWYAVSSSHGDNRGFAIGLTGGVFRTANEGQSWSQIADHSDLGGTNTRMVKIIANQVDPETLYVATSAGIYATYNSSAISPTWLPLITNKYAKDIEIHPVNNQILFATIADQTGPLSNWQFMRSVDGGQTWNPIPNQNQVTNAPNAEFVTIEVTAANTDFLYCTVDRGGSSNSEVWRFDSSNSSWLKIADNIQSYMGSGDGFGVSQFNANEIYVSHWVQFKKINYAGVLNGGQTGYSDLAVSYHMDVEDIVGDPVDQNVLWVCSHGGVYKLTINTGVWEDMTAGIGGAWIWRFAASATDPGSISFGADHDIANFSVTPYGSNWNPTFNSNYAGDGQRALIDNKDPRYLYFCASQGPWLFSNDYGASFSCLPYSSVSWIGEGVLNKENPATLFRLIQDGNVVIKRSFDRGQTNTTIADFTQAPFNYTNYTAWKVYTPEANGDYLLVHIIEDQGQWQPCNPCGPTDLYEKSHLWRTKNANDPVPTWEKLPLPKNGWPSGVTFDFDNPDITYVSYGAASNLGPNSTGTEMVYRMDYTNPSTVVGYDCSVQHPCINICSTGCTDLTQNLPSTGVGSDALAVEKGSNGGLYLGTDFGVYYTNNKYLTNGTGWQKFGADLPNVPCHGLEINYVINKVRVGLNGRGAWEHDLFCPPDFDLTFDNSTLPASGIIASGFYEAENNINVTNNFASTDITNGGDVTMRAGNAILVTTTGTNKVIFTPTSTDNVHLFIHACNHSGNSFKQQGNSGNSGGQKNETEKPITKDGGINFTYYPNPFTDHLHVDFLLEKSSDVKATIYNSFGQIMETITNKKYEAGEYTLRFDNSSLAPGVYFVKLDFGDKQYTKAVLKTASE